MTEIKRIFRDEHNSAEFDFSAALWASDEIHRVFAATIKNTILSDVDFVAETEDALVLVEYKNALSPDAKKPEKFKPDSDKSTNKIAYKYYDSWIYLDAIGKTQKPIDYVYVVEYPKADRMTRKELRNRIVGLLPFELQKLPQAQKKLIRSFNVLSVDEWNQSEEYGKFPIALLY